MSTSLELDSKISDYIERRIALSDLETWLVPRLRLYLANPDSAAARLVATVELCLAELQDGIRTERGVRQLLARRVPEKSFHWFTYPDIDASEETAAAQIEIETTGLRWHDPSPAWNSELRVASG